MLCLQRYKVIWSVYVDTGNVIDANQTDKGINKFIAIIQIFSWNNNSTIYSITQIQIGT